MFALSNIRLLVTGGLILAVFGYGYYLNYQLDSARAMLEEKDNALVLVGDYYERAVQEANANAKALEAYEVETGKALQALHVRHEKELANAKGIVKIVERIRYEKVDNDGDVAPVLGNTLDGLRRLQAVTTKDSNTSEAGQTSNSSRLDAMQTATTRADGNQTK